MPERNLLSERAFENGTNLVLAPCGAAQPDAGPARPRSTFWFGFWLAVALALTKAFQLGWPVFSPIGLAYYVHDWAVIVHGDVLFAIGVAAVAQVGVVLAARRPRLERAIWAALLLVSMLSIAYAVVSVQIFDYLRQPLTYPLIYLAGDIKNFRSSLGTYARAPLITAMLAAPVLYLVAAASTHRWIQPRRTVWFRIGQGLGVLALVAYVMLSRQVVAGPWSDRDDHRIAENSHWVLVSSCLIELLGGRSVRMDEQFDPADLEDFQVAAERRSGDPPPVELTHRPRNVIVVVLESVPTQHLSVYGSRYPTTPRLEAEAKHALIVENFYCHVGLTANAMVTLVLSVYPGLTWKEYTVEYPELPGVTLPQLLRPRGYRTAFLHSGDLEYVSQNRFLANRGFDDLWDLEEVAGGQRLFSWGAEDRTLMDGILRWIDQDRARPFYVLSWTIQTHHPYALSNDQEEVNFFADEPPPPGDDYHLNLYLNCLTEMDRQLGRLFDGLHERGLADDTLVVITGDHGEAFGHPHGSTYGHGGRLYQENVNVPLILWNPKMFAPGRRVDTVGGQVDLNPTVAHLLDVAPSETWQGRSLFDPLRPPRAYFYAANEDYLFGVREQNLKYVFNASRGRDELYDLSRDPAEQTNLARDHPDRCQRLRQRLAAWVDYEGRHFGRLSGSAE
jgi:arylsulfatase A-like enzyme